MPEHYLPTHFLAWLANGPAADDQHPLWLPDTGKALVKPKCDILDTTANSGSSGRVSCYSRKAMKLEASKLTTDVLDLTSTDEITNGLLRESVKNSSEIVQMLKCTTDAEKRTMDEIVTNASRMYDLDPTIENKREYISALRRQKELLEQRAVRPSAPSMSSDCVLALDPYDEMYNLENSFNDESVESTTPFSV